jgi:transcriptional regulator with XRE-family HTH domain
MEILFNKRLKLLRNEKGLKQAELAKAIGITQRKISYLETGQLEPDLLTLCKLSDYFGVTIDYLVGMKDY